MMQKPRVKLGDEIRIRFWDHMENVDVPHEYYIWGRVANLTPRGITLDVWSHINPEADRDPSGEEIKTYTILRRCIEEIVIHNDGQEKDDKTQPAN